MNTGDVIARAFCAAFSLRLSWAFFEQIDVRFRDGGAQNRPASAVESDLTAQQSRSSWAPRSLSNFSRFLGPHEVSQHDNIANRVPERPGDCTGSPSAATFRRHADRRPPAFRSVIPSASCESTLASVSLSDPPRRRVVQRPSIGSAQPFCNGFRPVHRHSSIR